MLVKCDDFSKACALMIFFDRLFIVPSSYQHVPQPAAAELGSLHAPEGDPRSAALQKPATTPRTAATVPRQSSASVIHAGPSLLASYHGNADSTWDGWCRHRTLHCYAQWYNTFWNRRPLTSC